MCLLIPCMVRVQKNVYNEIKAPFEIIVSLNVRSEFRPVQMLGNIHTLHYHKDGE